MTALCAAVRRGLSTWTLLDSLALRPEAQLKKPSIRAESKTLYMRSPPSLEEQTRANLDKTIAELGLEDGQQVVVTDPAFPLEFNFFLKFKMDSQA